MVRYANRAMIQRPFLRNELLLPFEPAVREINGFHVIP
jgi:hypothetical protein